MLTVSVKQHLTYISFYFLQSNSLMSKNYDNFSKKEKKMKKETSLTCGLQDVKNDRSKSVNTTCPSFWSKIFSGFRSLQIIPASQSRHTMSLSASLNIIHEIKRKTQVQLHPNVPYLLPTGEQNETTFQGCKITKVNSQLCGLFSK